MNSFLQYAAKDILDKHGPDLSGTILVFPNKRAALFMDNCLAHLGGAPLWSPVSLTISDLFRRHSRTIVADPVKLICDLHKSYASVLHSDETLDHFYGYGQIILNDFDDIDKALAEPQKIFQNVSDLQALDNLSYLSEQQKQILRQFFHALISDNPGPLKKRFLLLWNNLYKIYNDYRSRLLRQGLAYEGMLFRQTASDNSIAFNDKIYIFIGFNALTPVEQLLFSRLKQENKARFYWDYDTYYLNSAAGRSVARCLKTFPNELPDYNPDIYSNFNKEKKISFVSATTDNIQARFVTHYLRRDNNLRLNDGRRTAIVLCDEHLLPAVVRSIPDNANEINITTGYPLRQTLFESLITALIFLLTDGFDQKTGRFRLKAVNKLLLHPYIKYITPCHRDLYKKINCPAKQFYLTADDLSADEGSKLLFALPSCLKADDPALTAETLTRLTNLLRLMARNLSAANQARRRPLLAESLFQTFKIGNRLQTLVSAGDLVINISTLRRLIKEIIRTTSIPFNGEPVRGLQIMGLLETRNLDFDHVLLLSCNNANLPKAFKSSLIPLSVRKAYGLTTPDDNAAIYSYYFHRLLQRASDITITYNATAASASKGEMSPYMLALLADKNLSIKKFSIRTGSETSAYAPADLTKNNQILNILLQRFDSSRQPADKSALLLTPTAINTYLKCPLSFYYKYVAGLRKPDNDDLSIGADVFGTIFHDAAACVYNEMARQNNGLISAELLKTTADNNEYIDGVVRSMFNKNLFKIDPNSNNHPNYNGSQLINFNVIRTCLKQLLRLDASNAPFTLIGLEKDVMLPLTVKTPDGLTLQTTIGGRIDRIDRISCKDSDGKPASEKIRVIDYKTGKSGINKTPKSIDDIFNGVGDHPDYYLQAILYSDIARNNKKLNPDSLPASPSVIFVQHSETAGYNPTLVLNKHPINDVQPLSASFRNQISETVNSIFTSSLPFRPAADSNNCKYCPFTRLCGGTITEKK